MQQSPFFTQQPQTSVEKLNIEQEKTGLGNSVILARSEVPESHRRQADAYMILKTHYGLPVVNASINLDEKKFPPKSMTDSIINA